MFATHKQCTAWAPDVVQSMHAAFLLLRALRSSSSYTSGFRHDSHALALVARLGFGSFLLRFLSRSFIVICVFQSDMAATLFGCAAGSRAVKSFSNRLSKSVALNMAVAGSGLVCGAAPKQQQLRMASCSIIMASRGGDGRFLFSRALSSSCINPWPGFAGFKLKRFGARREVLKMVDKSGRRAFSATPRAEAQGGRASEVFVVFVVFFLVFFLEAVVWKGKGFCCLCLFKLK